MVRRWVRRWLGIDRIEHWIFIHGPLIPGSSAPEAIAAYRLMWDGRDDV